jgi:D-3-phosphoglycerate dehydrogenase
VVRPVVEVAGLLVGDGDLRVVDFLGYRLEFRPHGRLLVLENRDVPGVVGRIGTTLGEGGVNIAEIHLSRHEDAGEALAVLRLDQTPGESTLARLRALPEISRVLSVGPI